MNLIFMVEERSMKIVLDTILPKILPEDVDFITIAHSGKSDLEKSVPIKLKAWNQPECKFVIVRDQDTEDCIDVKNRLIDMTKGTGREVLIRIACRELEAWYFGDLEAVSKAYGRDLTYLANKKKYRNPDMIHYPKKELRKFVDKLQQLDGARRISKHMDIERNTSVSFQQLVAGIRKIMRM